MKTRRSTRIWAAVACGTLAVGGCDFTEERPLNYEKGVYLGEPHTPLDDKTLNALLARTVYQSDGGVVGSGGGSIAGATFSPEPTASRERAAEAQDTTGGAPFPTSAMSDPAAAAEALRRRATFQGSL